MMMNYIMQGVNYPGNYNSALESFFLLLSLILGVSFLGWFLQNEMKRR